MGPAERANAKVCLIDGLAVALAASAMQAFGIAASLLGGTRRNFGTMTMSLHSGLAASAGVGAARLAAAGFSSDPAIFDGAAAIGQLLSREWRCGQIKG